jgi:hypothetical protein
VSSAPDYIEPIVGWRAWLVVKGGNGFCLRSVVYDTVWLPRRELLARCLRRSLSRSLPWWRSVEHPPPARRCACGIYAAKQPDEAAVYLEGRSWGDALSVQRVIGRVSLWGRVVECKRGWRASHAYPQVIYVPSTRNSYWRRAEDPQEVAAGLANYGVPVQVLDADCCGPAEIAAVLSGGPASG